MNIDDKVRVAAVAIKAADAGSTGLLWHAVANLANLIPMPATRSVQIYQAPFALTTREHREFERAERTN